ncbi:uncharacterized protein LOC130823775 isoform X1 [Amaranthus tricolor]|uniref:uncharacterized protein LOC130823775 isoform X1 n=2 Tax=Amaranthus tricolor TaxID=29722 RepID=UPI0025850C81|nr:uncharacterized protein LOC130823775 isoform X1 [Amaranthus tricolor]XP_057544521.1 uncharacterized protein LOC130823775 isoform X1 [Amaranthus tricolor]
MSRFIAKIAGFFSKRTMAGIDKAGNRYFARNQLIDGVMKEKRWVIFEGEDDPTSIPVEWICWLNGQRKNAPTPEEMAELEARREFLRQNVERLKKEEEERRAIQRNTAKITGKVGGPDLNSFLRQVPKKEGNQSQEEASGADNLSEPDTEKEKTISSQEMPGPWTTEPSGSGTSFKPGTWQPPS